MEEDIRQYTKICSFVQRKYREGILETKEMDCLPGWMGKKGVRARRNGEVRMRREDASLSLSFLHKILNSKSYSHVSSLLHTP